MKMSRRFSPTPYLFLAPALVLTALFVFYPFFRVIYLGFTEYDIITDPKWVGLGNFVKMFGEDNFYISLKNSLLYLIVTPIIIVLAVSLALVVNRNLVGISFFRALYYIPVITGSIAVGTMWRWMFASDGLVNSTMLSLGLATEAVDYTYHEWLTLPVCMLLTVWTGVGYYMVVFVAGLQSISNEVYEAALIDGCNNFQKHWYISLPGLRPVITFVAIISSSAAIKVFNEIYVVTGDRGGLLNSAYTMVFYIYKEAFNLSHFGYASAVAIVLLIITLTLSILNLRISERGQEA